MRWGPQVQVVQREDAVVALFVLVCPPWAWFRAMGKRLLALPQVEGDLSQVTLDPRHRRT